MSTSGNAIVDEISNLRINSIPEAWYRTVRQGKQPNALAILVLWDLLYWYKWAEIRDEETGLVVGYKKKFKADLLQRSYDAIAEKFGITKRQATETIIFLEGLGVLRRVFRTVMVGDVKCCNVLFIELVPKTIKAISDIDTDTPENEGEVSRQNGTPLPENEGEVSRQNGTQIQSITQSITQTNSQANSQSEFMGVQAPDQEKKLAKSKQKKQKTEKHKYGEYENVLLSDDEYKKLVDKVGNEKADAVIKNFSELKEMKGYTYKSDYLALLKWGIRAYEEQNSRTGSGKNGRFNKESLADRDFFAGTEYEGATA